MGMGRRKEDMKKGTQEEKASVEKSASRLTETRTQQWVSVLQFIVTIIFFTVFLPFADHHIQSILKSIVPLRVFC